MLLRALAAIAALFLASCGSVRMPVPDIKPYRIEIQQGNYISQEMVARLKLGMSKDQVRFVLGTPLITDSFHPDRWDYVFRRQKVNSRELEHRKIAVFFDNGKLKRIEGDATSSGGVAADAVKTAQANAPTPKPQAAASAKAAAPKAPAAKSGATAPAQKMSAPDLTIAEVKTPAGRPAASMLTPEVPGDEPEARREPVSGLAPEKPAAAPDQAESEQPAGKKSWWERLKEKLKF